MMNKLKWAYVAGEVWAFIQVHNLLPIIISFAMGWYISYIQTANMKQFKLQMSNQQYTFQMDVIKELDHKLGVVEGISTNSAIMKSVISPTPTEIPTPTPRPLPKKPIAQD